jgi:hypothetical protein
MRASNILPASLFDRVRLAIAALVCVVIGLGLALVLP